ncbi:unnamed protein product [Gordionus sp. m RMFG-2023]
MSRVHELTHRLEERRVEEESCRSRLRKFNIEEKSYHDNDASLFENLKIEGKETTGGKVFREIIKTETRTRREGGRGHHVYLTRMTAYPSRCPERSPAIREVKSILADNLPIQIIPYEVDLLEFQSEDPDDITRAKCIEALRIISSDTNWIATNLNPKTSHFYKPFNNTNHDRRYSS